MIKPFLHWVGGKRQLIPKIKEYMPIKYNTYYEPFVGAGAVLFELQPKIATINDLNSELIDCYRALRQEPFSVLSHLEDHMINHSEEYYYKIRQLDRENDFKECFQGYDIYFKAARTIYLNRSGFNGLYRVNGKGYFNVPYGNHDKYIPDSDSLLETSRYLQRNDITITNIDFKLVVKDAQKGDFVYFDPPYIPISETSNFTNYTKEGFTKWDQIRLRDCFKKLSDRGCYCLLSNSGADLIKELYKDFKIVEVQATRVLNCKANKRGKVPEVLIMNY